MKSRKLIVGLSLAAAVATGAGVAMASNEGPRGHDDRARQEVTSAQAAPDQQRAGREGVDEGGQVGAMAGDIAGAQAHDEMGRRQGMEQVVKNVLDGLVKDGTLSSEQAEKVGAALKEAHDQMSPRGPRAEGSQVEGHRGDGRHSHPGDRPLGAPGEIVPDGATPPPAMETPAGH